MVYYEDLITTAVYGYDETDPSQLPYIQQAIDNGWKNITGSWPLPPPPPTEDENQSTASTLLSTTDWTTIADVGSPINSPYLSNQDEFIAYRNSIRKIAVYPTAGILIWPPVPVEIWK